MIQKKYLVTYRSGHNDEQYGQEFERHSNSELSRYTEL